MESAAKNSAAVLLSVVYKIGGFIYKTGWIIESVIGFILSLTLLPLLRFLRKCTPKNIFEWVCSLGEKVIAVALKFYQWITHLLIWAAHSIVSDFAYWAPAISGIAVVILVIFLQSHTVALAVNIDGKTISYVNNEQEFSSAVTAVEKELAQTLGENYCMYTAPEYKFVFIKKNKMADADNLYAQAYRAVTEEIGHHYGLYVDGQFVAAAEKKSTIETVLNELKAPFETGAADERVEFVSNVEVRTGLYAPAAMVTTDALRQMFEGATDPQYYTIEEDDYLSDISEKTGLSKKMLYYLNPELDETRLIPGKKLLISEPDVYLGVKVVRTTTYEEEIGYSTVRIEDSSLYVNQTKVKTADCCNNDNSNHCNNHHNLQ